MTLREFAVLQRLSTPEKIQKYLNAVPINHELDGETIHSVRSVMRHRRAHCIEGAMLAACAFWVHGEPPLVMHLDCAWSDYPHVVALFRRGNCWGAISKTNGAVLRYRDPIYRSLRELALSYFHEYSDRRGDKTLRSYSPAFDMRRIETRLWVANGDNCQKSRTRWRLAPLPTHFGAPGACADAPRSIRAQSVESGSVPCAENATARLA